MGAIGNKMLSRLQIYAQKGLSAKAMGFRPDWQLRIMIAEQMYQAYSSNRVPMTRPPRKIVPQIADIIYRQLANSPDPDHKRICEACGIEKDENGELVAHRSYNEMTNDIACYEVFRHIWGVDTSNHAKATCEDAAYRLIELGQEHSDARALSSGIDKLSKLHNDFQQEEQDFSRTAETDIDIISDVTLVRPDATQMSRQAIEALKKKYGAYIDKEGGIEALLSAGSEEYTPDAGEADDGDDDDFFESAERQILFREDE